MISQQKHPKLIRKYNKTLIYSTSSAQQNPIFRNNETTPWFSFTVSAQIEQAGISGFYAQIMHQNCREINTFHLGAIFLNQKIASIY